MIQIDHCTNCGSAYQACPHCGAARESPDANYCGDCGYGFVDGRPPQTGHRAVSLGSQAATALGTLLGIAIVVSAVALLAVGLWRLWSEAGVILNWRNRALLASEAVIEENILDLANAERANHGLALLECDPILDEIAEKRSQDLIQRGFPADYDPVREEQLFLRLLGQHDYVYDAAEEVNQFNPTIRSPGLAPADLAKEIVQIWLNTYSQRTALLDPRFEKGGVGVRFTGMGDAIATLVLVSQ